MNLCTKQAEDYLSSEDHRSACEVRAVLAMPFSERRPYLAMVGAKRGLVASDVLANAVKAEYLRRKGAK